MKIAEKISNKQLHRKEEKSITIVCLGDSVTEGCFEYYINKKGEIDTIFDRNNSYSEKLKRLLALLYPTVQVNVINCGYSGGNVNDGFRVLERDVLPFSPDLVIISYGLNDSVSGEDGIESYGKTLSAIFEKIKSVGAEIIFLTENYMCTNISPHIKEDNVKKVAQSFANIQNSGLLENYFNKAKEVCQAYGVKVCDLYSVWKAMEQGGVNTTELLANKLNHPIREYHNYIAIKLLEKIMGI